MVNKNGDRVYDTYVRLRFSLLIYTLIKRMMPVTTLCLQTGLIMLNVAKHSTSFVKIHTSSHLIRKQLPTYLIDTTVRE